MNSKYTIADDSLFRSFPAADADIVSIAKRALKQNKSRHLFWSDVQREARTLQLAPLPTEQLNYVKQQQWWYEQSPEDPICRPIILVIFPDHTVGARILDLDQVFVIVFTPFRL